MAYTDILNDTYINGAGEEVPAAEYDALVEILDVQLHGALVAAGAGVVSGGAVSAGTGLAVLIAALQAIVNTSAGYCYIATAGPLTLTGLTDNATLYITASAVLQSGGGTSDSRQFGTVVFNFQTGATPALGSMVLAQVITASGAVSSVTDLRTFLPASSIAQVQAALTAVEAALGTDYFPTPGTAAATVTDRLVALESGGGGGSGPLYADGLQRSAGNPETVGQEFGSLETRLTTVEGEVGSLGGGGTTVIQPAPWDVDATNQAQALLARIANGPLDEGLAEAASQVDCLIFVPGIWGDGSNGSPSFRDDVNSTWN